VAADYSEILATIYQIQVTSSQNIAMSIVNAISISNLGQRRQVLHPYTIPNNATIRPTPSTFQNLYRFQI
jgi:hypothetical protein